jgi:hypothetical protein
MSRMQNVGRERPRRKYARRTPRSLAEFTLGSTEAIELFEDIISAMRENNSAAANSDTPVTSH